MILVNIQFLNYDTHLRAKNIGHETKTALIRAVMFFSFHHICDGCIFQFLRNVIANILEDPGQLFFLFDGSGFVEILTDRFCGSQCAIEQADDLRQTDLAGFFG
jgi:hypothetical protein